MDLRGATLLFTFFSGTSLWSSHRPDSERPESSGCSDAGKGGVQARCCGLGSCAGTHQHKGHVRGASGGGQLSLPLLGLVCSGPRRERVSVSMATLLQVWWIQSAGSFDFRMNCSCVEGGVEGRGLRPCNCLGSTFSLNEGSPGSIC